eukprot:TRINITY_DN28043_c0_g1_i2.p1 TRINITY_DN28043_c0_g1~~TRINITY_DN28043_c0_g1_i2.p1  ORF type:complete len:221 (+),score=36.70 TRINITY_DN28043_c0_g1_i2:157-819(+)
MHTNLQDIWERRLHIADPFLMHRNLNCVLKLENEMLLYSQIQAVAQELQNCVVPASLSVGPPVNGGGHWSPSQRPATARFDAVPPMRAQQQVANTTSQQQLANTTFSTSENQNNIFVPPAADWQSAPVSSPTSEGVRKKVSNGSVPTSQPPSSPAPPRPPSATEIAKKPIANGSSSGPENGAAGSEVPTRPNGATAAEEDPDGTAPPTDSIPVTKLFGKG